MDKCGQIKFGGKATYKIKVHGKLDESRSGLLGGMTIESEMISKEQFISTFTGQIRDQAALSGILNTLYDMHLPILSVMCLGTESNENNINL